MESNRIWASQETDEAIRRHQIWHTGRPLKTWFWDLEVLKTYYKRKIEVYKSSTSKQYVIYYRLVRESNQIAKIKWKIRKKSEFIFKKKLNYERTFQKEVPVYPYK